MWVVTASNAFDIKPYEWEFPILGKLSYKGFFIRKEAEKEAEKLKKMGLDTDIGSAGGWSTLGLFRDPILSEMLRKKEGALANLRLAGVERRRRRDVEPLIGAPVLVTAAERQLEVGGQ